MSTIRRLLWPRHRWRRIALAFFVTILGPVAYGWYQTRPAQLIPRVEAMLRHQTGAAVRVQQAEMAWGPKLVIQGLELSVPDMTGRVGRVLDTEYVEIGISPIATLRGRLVPTTFAAHHPVLYLTEDAQTGMYSIQKLRVADDSSPSDGSATPPPKLLPESLIDGGEIRIAEVRDEGYHLLGTIDVLGRLTESADQPDQYQFTLAGRQVGTQEKVSITGQVEMDSLSMELRVDGLRVDTAQGKLLPNAFRAWHDAIRPEGEFKNVELQLGPDADGRLVLRSARMEFHGVALSLPAELLGLGDDDYEIRMQNVEGVTRWSQGVIHDRFTGTIEGVDYLLVGKHGLNPREPFDLTLATDVFELPEEPRFFFALPPIAKVYHDRFRPSGKFKTTVRLWREEEGAAVKTDGVVEIIDAKASYKNFPYPVDAVHAGRLRFTDEAVTIHDMQAVGPTGAQITLNGRIAPPNDDAQVDVKVKLANVPLDEHMTGAMQPQHRAIVDTFVDAEAHARLLKAGLLSEPAPEAEPDADSDDAPPPFSLGGRLKSGTVTIRRPYGVDKDYDVILDLDVAGLGFMFTHWPYPMTAVAGRLEIGELVTLEALRFAGPTGATATVAGTLDQSDGVIRPKIAITDAKLPIDGLLLASIPAPQDEWVRRLHLAGAIGGSGRVFAEPAEGPETEDLIDFAFDLKLKGGKAMPHGATYEVEDLAADLQLTRDGLTIGNASAKRGATDHALRGVIDWSGQSPTFALDLSATDMAVNETMLDLVPPDHPAAQRAAAVFAKHEPDGIADVAARWSSDADGETFDLRFSPQQMAFSLGGDRLAMTDMSGEARVHPTYLTLDRVSATFPEGTGTLSGVVGFGETSTAIQFEATGREIGTTSRALLPEAALAVLDALDLQTGYQVRSASLIHRPDTHDDPGTEFKGVIALQDASADLGVAVTDFNGKIGVIVKRTPQRPTPEVNLKLDADDLRLDERLVERLSLRLRGDGRDGAIRITDLRGTMYGGIIIGEGVIVPGADGWYGARLTMHEVALEPFLNPGDPWEPLDATDEGEDWLLPRPLRRREHSGLVSASLNLEAKLDSPGRRSGRGSIEVHDASLFDRPLSLALLQASNLRLPQSSSLDRLSSRFIIDDDTVRFDSLSFNARFPNLTITGTGTMDWPTRSLDLTMYNRNPEGWQLGPITDVFNSIKDELLVIRVEGPAQNPQARVESFSGLRRTWDDLFGRAQARPTAPGEVSRD